MKRRITTLKKEEAQDLLETVDTTKTKGKRDYVILSLLLAQVGPARP